MENPLAQVSGQPANPSSLRRKRGSPSASPTCPSIRQQRGKDAGKHLLPPRAASTRQTRVQSKLESRWKWPLGLPGTQVLKVWKSQSIFFFFLFFHPPFFPLSLEAAWLPCDESSPVDVRPRVSPALAPRSFPAGLGFPLLAPVTLPVPTGASHTPGPPPAPRRLAMLT